MGLRSDQVKTGENKYPNQVYKMPVQTGFFDHQVMATFFKFIQQGHNQHNNIDDGQSILYCCVFYAPET